MMSSMWSQRLPVSIRISSMLGLIIVGQASIPMVRSFPLVSRITGLTGVFYDLYQALICRSVQAFGTLPDMVTTSACSTSPRNFSAKA